jgi:hypothetical protein
MHYHEIIDRIKQLNLPACAKAELLMLYNRARSLGERILRFIEHHKELSEALLIGAIMSFLLVHVPWIGGLLALCALVTAAAIGLMKQMRADLEQLFITA